MKKCLLLLVSVLLFGLFSGCDWFQDPEGCITFRLEEAQESSAVWSYMIEPSNSLQKVRDEIKEDENGVLFHEWIFEGLLEGDVTVVFQYAEEGELPLRTVTYSCFVDEQMHVGLLETQDSADLIGTAGDEGLIRAVSALVALELEELPYPTEQVDNEYATRFLLQYANLFCSEYAQEYEEIKETGYDQYIALAETEVDELLDLAFGARFGTEQFVPDNERVIYNAHQYYFAVADVPAIATVAAGDAAEQLQFVFTMTREYDSLDGSAQATAVASVDNPTGLSITSISVQTNS